MNVPESRLGVGQPTQADDRKKKALGGLPDLFGNGLELPGTFRHSICMQGVYARRLDAKHLDAKRLDA
jgi:hypothetical protein